MRQVSLPVILNEPLSAMQKVCEALGLGADLFEQGATHPDSMMRSVFHTIGFISAFNFAKIRKRKPFNPMLGETFEFVNDRFRFLSEKVEHIPKQISCYELEGKDYKITGYS